MRRVLLIAYHFPPVSGLGAAGAQRAVKFARYLPETGYQPVVLTLRQSAYESYFTFDEETLAKVSPEVPVVRTGMLRLLKPLLAAKAAVRRSVARLLSNTTDSTNQHPQPQDEAGPESRGVRTTFQRIKDSATDLAEIPDEVSGWMAPAVIAGFRAIRREKIDLILATGRPWTSLVIGAVLKSLSRKPLVVDFRDPWMTNPFRPVYSGLKEKSERWLESWVVRSADLVLANTESLRDEFAARFGPDVGARSITVLNGFDANDVSAVLKETGQREQPQQFTLVHPGFLYGQRDPRNLLQAIRLLMDEQRVDPRYFACDLIGPIELDYDVQSLVEDLGISRLVRLTGTVSQRRSLAAVAGCDAALLLQPGTATQIPSKLFEFVGFGKYTIAVAAADSSVGKLVRENRLGAVVDPDDVRAIAEAIHSAYAQHRREPGSLAIPEDCRQRFDVRIAVSLAGQAMSALPGSAD